MALVVMSGSRLFQESLTLSLANLRVENPVLLLVDVPVGFVLSALQRHEAATIVQTLSPSPYYLHDLLTYNPSALLSGNHNLLELRWALQEVGRGNRILPPKLSIEPLTPGEREVLRLVAVGQEREQIASHLGLKRRSLDQALWRLREKLFAANNEELRNLYWWGSAQGIAPIYQEGLEL